MGLYDVKIVVTDESGNELAFIETVDMSWARNPKSGVDTTYGMPEHVREKCAIDQVRARHPFLKDVRAKGSGRHCCVTHEGWLRR